jgi:hypothetical protein
MFSSQPVADEGLVGGAAFALVAFAAAAPFGYKVGGQSLVAGAGDFGFVDEAAPAVFAPLAVFAFDGALAYAVAAPDVD